MNDITRQILQALEVVYLPSEFKKEYTSPSDNEGILKAVKGDEEAEVYMKVDLNVDSKRALVYIKITVVSWRIQLRQPQITERSFEVDQDDLGGELKHTMSSYNKTQIFRKW